MSQRIPLDHAIAVLHRIADTIEDDPEGTVAVLAELRETLRRFEDKDEIALRGEDALANALHDAQDEALRHFLLREAPPTTAMLRHLPIAGAT